MAAISLAGLEKLLQKAAEGAGPFDPAQRACSALLSALKELPAEDLVEPMPLPSPVQELPPPPPADGEQEPAGEALGGEHACRECGRRFDSAIGLKAHVDKTGHGRQQLHQQTGTGG